MDRGDEQFKKENLEKSKRSDKFQLHFLNLF